MKIDSRLTTIKNIHRRGVGDAQSRKLLTLRNKWLLKSTDWTAYWESIGSQF